MSRSLNYQSVTIRFADWRKRTASALVKVLALTLFGAMPVAVVSAPISNAVVVGGLTCTSKASGLNIVANQGKVFYVDGTSKTASEDLDSNYIGYSVWDSAGNAWKNVWVKVSNFSAPVSGIAIAPISTTQTKFQVTGNTETLSDTKTAFFALKATGVNGWVASSAQAGDFNHTVTVYQGDPDSGASTTLATCKYTFEKVSNTIEASANKVTSQTLSNTSPMLGETVTLTVNGNLGTTGAGENPDLDIIWLSANPYSNFPVGALRLEHVEFSLVSNTNCASPVVIVDKILITGVNNTCYTGKDYVIKYTFKVIGTGPSNTRLAGIANIASGTQTKHTAVDPAVFKTINLSGAVSSASGSLTIQKGETHTVGSDVESITTTISPSYGLSASTSYYKLYYVETVTSTSSLTLDYFVDSASAGMKMDTSTVQVRVNTGSWSSIVPNLISGQYYFPGPFTVSGSQTLYFSYVMYLPVNTAGSPAGDTSTATNTFSGLVGSTTIGSVTYLTDVYDPTGKTSSISVTTPPAPKSVRTDAATSVETSTAVLNGYASDTVTARGYFRFSTIEESVTAGTVSDTRTASLFTGSDTATYSLSGIRPHTTYYFQFYQLNPSELSGGVQSFTTDGGSATTNNPSSITKTTASLNGQYLLNGETYTVYYDFATNAALTTDTRTVTAAFTNIDGTNSTSVTGLTAGTTYYYRICITSDTATVLGDPETVCGDLKSFTTESEPASTPTPPAGPSTPPVVITWPTPGPITYPTPLSDTQLNAVATCNGAPVTGTYVYTPALGSILDPGTYTLLVTFVPSSGSACGSASTTVRIVVNAPSRTITWPNPPTAQGPATLGPNQLNAVCSVPGTLTYTPPAGTVLPVGTYTLSVTCTPTDPKIAPISTTVPFTVVAELAKITWPTPAPQEGPLRLGAAQLNAKCSVPGRLVYDPLAGTVLEPGTYTLKVTCIPNDPKIPAVSTTVVLVVEGPLAAPKNAVTGPNTFTQGYIKWDPVKNATGYSVDIRGEVVCKTTTATTCTVQKTIGPKTPVIVTALGKDKKSASARAVYSNDKLLPAIEVNFATARFNIDAKAQAEINRVCAIIKREGFTIVEITGHTDPRGGALNIELSNNRSQSLKKAMLKLVPNLEITNAGLSYDEPKASNATKAGMAKNRRSVGAVK